MITCVRACGVRVEAPVGAAYAVDGGGAVFVIAARSRRSAARYVVRRYVPETSTERCRVDAVGDSYGHATVEAAHLAARRFARRRITSRV